MLNFNWTRICFNVLVGQRRMDCIVYSLSMAPAMLITIDGYTLLPETLLDSIVELSIGMTNNGINIGTIENVKQAFPYLLLQSVNYIGHR